MRRRKDPPSYVVHSSRILPTGTLLDWAVGGAAGVSGEGTQS
jgi:hypothetical protein